MKPGTKRRILLGVSGALLAAVVAVLLQLALVRLSVTETTAEAYAVTVGVGLATPLLRSAIRPVDAAAADRSRIVTVTTIGSLLIGMAAVTVLLFLDASGSLPVVGGAGGAYGGGAFVRSFALARSGDRAAVEGSVVDDSPMAEEANPDGTATGGSPPVESDESDSEEAEEPSDNGTDEFEYVDDPQADEDS
jgi:hypothetical protein